MHVGEHLQQLCMQTTTSKMLRILKEGNCMALMVMTDVMATIVF